MAVSSRSMPRFSDAHRLHQVTEELRDFALDNYRRNRDEAARRWYAIHDEVVTGKDRLFDTGGSLALIGFCMSLAGLHLIGEGRHRAIRTPPSRQSIVLIFAIAYCGVFFAIARSFSVDVARYEVVPWADAAAIPVAGTVVFAVLAVGWISLAVLWPLFLKVELPVALVGHRWRRKLARSAIELLFLPLIGLFGFIAFDMVGRPTFPGIPFALLLAYVALTTRAIALARINRKGLGDDPGPSAFQL
jgi:hypothetical protein